MLIDCNTCIARGPACRDCVVTVLLQRPPLPATRPPAPRVADADPVDLDDPDPIDFDDDEQRAIAQLSEAGLVPPLRLVPKFVPLRSTGTE